MAIVGRRWTRYLPGRRRAPAAPHPVLPVRFAVDLQDAGAGVSVLAVSGEVDIATAPQLRAALQSSAESDRPLLIDLSDVTFMDSTGLALLLATTRDRTADLAIVAPEGPVRLLFAVSGTEAQLPLHTSRREAMRAIGG